MQSIGVGEARMHPPDFLAVLLRAMVRPPRATTVRRPDWRRWRTRPENAPGVSLTDAPVSIGPRFPS